MHVIHTVGVEMAHSDLTGLLAAAAGAVLVGLGVMIPARHRNEVPGTPTRRWVRRGVAVVAGLAVAMFAVQPLVVGMVQTHKFREAIGAPPSTDYAAVTFPSTDGLRLSGWYRPSTNGAAVVS